MAHEIEIQGCLDVPDKVKLNDVLDAFLEFVESHNWYFGGGFNEFMDDHCVSVEVREED